MEVRMVVAAVDAGIAAGWPKQDTGHLCDGIDAETTLVRDNQGRPRRLLGAMGGEDSVTTLEASYDEAGMLRFLFIRAGAVNDSTLEQRFWFGRDGVQLHERQTDTGEGYTWWRPSAAAIEALRIPSNIAATSACPDG
jgi:hypothetical protein